MAQNWPITQERATKLNKIKMEAINGLRGLRLRPGPYYSYSSKFSFLSLTVLAQCPCHIATGTGLNLLSAAGRSRRGDDNLQFLILCLLPFPLLSFTRLYILLRYVVDAQAAFTSSVSCILIWMKVLSKKSFGVEGEVKLGGSMNLHGKYNHPEALTEMPSTDQLFLLNFIMSTYLGPDVYSDNPRRSASQRLAEGLPPYTSKNLGDSVISISQLESLYYYLLRYAHPALGLEPNMLHSYLEGNLRLPSSELLEARRQFTSIFPLNIHERKRYSVNNEIVKGIVLVDDPVTSHLKDDVERFKKLSGLTDLKIDIIKSLSYQHGCQKSTEDDGLNSMKNSEQRKISRSFANGNGITLATFRENNGTMHQLGSQPRSAYPPVIPMLKHLSEGASKKTCKRDGPSMMSLVTVPNVDQNFPDSSIILNGTAKKGIVGPPIGVLDIGVSKVAYFFRVALPGVRKDYCEFSCEIESNGKVHLQGSTCGGGRIKKRSRVFHMTLQQLCPGGEFTLSFSLPGPVDPRLYSPNFRSDGIFEAVVIKHEC